MAKVVVMFQIPLRQDGDKLRRLREATAPRRMRTVRRAAHLGPLHQPFAWKALHRELTERFGGWMLVNEDALGEWGDPDQAQPVRERSRVYEVDVPEERLDEIEALLRRACVTFVQRCIRMVVRGEASLLNEGSDDEPL